MASQADQEAGGPAALASVGAGGLATKATLAGAAGVGCTGRRNHRGGVAGHAGLASAVVGGPGVFSTATSQVRTRALSTNMKVRGDEV